MNGLVAARIRQARMGVGLLQADLGKRLSPSRTHAAVSDMERGKSHISVDTLAQCAVILGKPPGWFFETEPGAVEPARETVNEARITALEREVALVRQNIRFLAAILEADVPATPRPTTDGSKPA